MKYNKLPINASLSTTDVSGKQRAPLSSPEPSKSARFAVKSPAKTPDSSRTEPWSSRAEEDAAKSPFFPD